MSATSNSDFKVALRISAEPDGSLKEQTNQLKKDLEEVATHTAKIFEAEYAAAFKRIAASAKSALGGNVPSTPGNSLTPGDKPASDPGSPKEKPEKKISSPLNSLTKGVGGFISSLAKVTKVITGVFSTLFSLVKSIFSAFKNAVMFIPSMLGKVIGTLAKTALAAVGTAVAGFYGASKALSPAAYLQSAEESLTVMLGGNREAAQSRLAVLKRYAKETNYSPEQVVGAANLMQAYGMYDFQNLKLIGDAANAFRKDPTEVVRSISYMKAGRSGEAMESLATIGITRDVLRQEGIRFRRDGMLLGNTQKAVDAIYRVMRRRYGGMTSRIGGTFSGAMEQMKGEFWDMLATGFKGALKPMTDLMNNAITPLASSLGNALAKIDWQEKLQPLVNVASGLSKMLQDFISGSARRIDDAKIAMSIFVGDLKNLGISFLAGMGKITAAIFSDIGTVLSRMFLSGGLGKFIQGVRDGFIGAFVAGTYIMRAGLVSAFQLVTDLFSGKLREAMARALASSYPGGEAELDQKINNAKAAAWTSLYNDPHYRPYIQFPLKQAPADFPISRHDPRTGAFRITETVPDFDNATWKADTPAAVKEEFERRWRQIKGWEQKSTFNPGTFIDTVKAGLQAASPWFKSAIPNLMQGGTLFTEALSQGNFRTDDAVVEAAKGFRTSFGTMADHMGIVANRATSVKGRSDYYRLLLGEKGNEIYHAHGMKWKEFEEEQLAALREKYKDRFEKAGGDEKALAKEEERIRRIWANKGRTGAWKAHMEDLFKAYEEARKQMHAPPKTPNAPASQQKTENNNKPTAAETMKQEVTAAIAGLSQQLAALKRPLDFIARAYAGTA